MDWKDELYRFQESLDPSSVMYEFLSYISVLFGMKEAKMGAYYDFREPIMCVYVACSKLSIQSPIFECLPEPRREEMINWVINKASRRRDWQTNTSAMQIIAHADTFFIQERNKANEEKGERILSLTRAFNLPAVEKE